MRCLRLRLLSLFGTSRGGGEMLKNEEQNGLLFISAGNSVVFAAIALSKCEVAMWMELAALTRLVMSPRGVW